MSPASQTHKPPSRCKSIVEMLNAFPLVILPSKNVASSGNYSNMKKLKSCLKKEEKLGKKGKNAASGPDFPNINNVDKMPMPWRKCYQFPVRTNFDQFDPEPLEEFMEECPLLISTSKPPHEWAEYVEDWSGLIYCTHSRLPMAPLYRVPPSYKL
ncbi:unnamed protein product [Phyllotreta striolata]|uniref:Uncharacterized protein n=1 Tax=Phyllotreta striolata TaxID=444603 RepID=A0A9N9TW59_PHYSR|nr:unnamed protein product [Phyllotreta striolata]